MPFLPSFSDLLCHLQLQENVEDFLQGHSIESMLGALNELYSKYKYMETSFEKSKGVYKSKIPEVEQTLEIINMMIKKRDDGEDMVTHYPLCDTLYSEAKVDTSESKICLWVGASTMVEYSYDEGRDTIIFSQLLYYLCFLCRKRNTFCVWNVCCNLFSLTCVMSYMEQARSC